MKKQFRVEAERNAFDFRNKNGYSASEPIHLGSLLLKKNVLTVYRKMSDNVSGISIKTGESMCFMLINSSQTLGRQHFTIGHELYHLFIQEHFKAHKCKVGLFSKQKDIEEKKADFFAASLLLPEIGIKQLVPIQESIKKNSITQETIFSIQQYYRLSINAVIFRLIDLNYIDKSYYDMLHNNKKETARRLGFDMSLFEPGNEGKIIGDYAIKAGKLFRGKKISEAYYLELLNTVQIDPFDGNEEK